MSRHNVRGKVIFPRDYIKNINHRKIDKRSKNPHMVTKIVEEKQVLRKRYIELMDDAERAVGRKEAIYLLRDAEIVWQKINS